MSDLPEQIDALLALNAKGAVSHTIPGLAAELLEKAASALRSKPVAGVEVKPRTNEQIFNVGYMIAVANLMHLHDEPTMAADVLREAGIDASALEGLDFTDFDLSVLHALFAALKEAGNG